MDIKYRNLGRTGVKVSPLCLGTMNFGPRTNDEDAETILNAALDAGINFVDTANFYGQPMNDGTGQGYSESLLGRLFQKNKRREQVILATKVHATMDRDDPNMAGNSRRHIIQQCEASLKRLQTDYIDLYQMHRPQPSIPIDETLRALDDLVRSGKVRYIGGSGYQAWQFVESIWVAKEHHLNRFVTEQPRYSILFRDIEKNVVPAALQYGVGLLPYSPLAGGILAGKYRRDEEPPEGSRAAFAAWKDWAESFFTDNVWEVLDVLSAIAEEKGCTMSQLSLAWVAAQPGISSVIIGPRTPEQFTDNLGALDVELTEDDLAKINEIAPVNS